MKKKQLWYFLLVVILLLAYAALDDITTNKQSNYVWEYAFIFFSLYVIIIIGYFYKKSKRG